MNHELAENLAILNDALKHCLIAPLRDTNDYQDIKSRSGNHYFAKFREDFGK